MVIEKQSEKGIIYGLIFMDCAMPIMNGYDSSAAIRRFYDKKKMEQPKIVAVTGHTEDIYIKKAY
jgi:CheY-like chemotaxis protein